MDLEKYIKPRNTQSVCTTRETETDKDTIFLKEKCPAKKKYPVRRAQGWGALD
jgi:hypothetical protein